MTTGKKHVFKATVARCVYETESFSTYATNVSKNDYPFIKLNKYGNCSIIGELPSLTVGAVYDVTATEEESKHGTSYRVVNIRRDSPNTAEDTKVFLEEVLTSNQADALYKAYPDIIARVKDNRLKDVDLSQLPGIGKKTFTDIVNKITKSFFLFDLVVEFGNILSINILSKIYFKYTSVDLLREKLSAAPYATLTCVSGIGFKKADSIVMSLQESKIIDFGYDIMASADRCYACALHLLRMNEDEGHTKMNLADLRSQCMKLAPSAAKHFPEAIKSEDIYYDKNTMSIALKKTHDEERYIAQTIIDSFGNGCTWECDVESYRKIGEFDLSDEQLSVIDSVCKNSVSILNGFAGSGKSFSTQALINMLKDKHKTYLLLAPTGKSSKVLADFTGGRALTIHRGLGYIPPMWMHNVNNKLDADIVIVDETSMADVNLFKHLIESIDFERTKLLMIGDNAQLPSVGCGNLFHDFMQSGVIPTITLTKVFRYGEGGLSKIATDVRNQKVYLDNSMRHQTTIFGANGDYAFFDVNADKMKKTAIDIYKKLLGFGCTVSNIQILTAKNVGEYGADIMNDAIQKVVNPYYGSKSCMKSGDIVYFKGDLVMQCKNNYRAKLSKEHLRYADDDLSNILGGGDQEAFVANGENGIILDACAQYCNIDFGGVVVRYYPKDMRSVKLGYAITTHKSQGSSIDHIIVCSPQSDIFMINSNLLYVALTRMRKKCFHLGSINTVNSAIKKKANLSRSTFMKNMLIEMCKNKKSEPSQEHENVVESNMLD